MRTWWRRQQFDPGIGGIFANPFYFARKGLAMHLRELAPQLASPILDVGCGRMPYRSYFSQFDYVGLELDTPQNRCFSSADVFYDGGQFPFPAKSFQSVLCSQVFEHVFMPQEFLKEIHRVLRPGGRLLMTVPFIWDEHEQPRDFARYSSFGLTAILESSGFTVLQHRKSVADVRLVFQLMNAYLYKVTISRWRAWNVGVTMTLMALVNAIGMIVGWLMPRNQDLYLDNIILAEKG
jgi:SAM-dependent methyltransferase